MMRRSFVALFTIYCLLSTSVFAYVSPGNPTGHVNDFATILKPETISSLETTLSNFGRETSHEISVVTVPTLGDETIETYAEKLFQEWGIGKEKEDNGLLLLIAPTERVTRIEVGYGLEGAVTDIESGRIIREILTPAFKAGDFDGGITQAVNMLVGLIKGEIMPDNSSPTAIDWSRWFPYFFFFLAYLGAILARSQSWWAGGIIGGVLGIAFFSGIIYITICAIVGLILDFVVSRAYQTSKVNGVNPPWWIGGGGGSGGFGGFGGGMSGGGGASGRW